MASISWDGVYFRSPPSFKLALESAVPSRYGHLGTEDLSDLPTSGVAQAHILVHSYTSAGQVPRQQGCLSVHI